MAAGDTDEEEIQETAPQTSPIVQVFPLLLLFSYKLPTII